MAEKQLREEQFRRILCKEIGIKHTFRYNDNQLTTIAHPIPIKALTEKDFNAPRQSSDGGLRLQVHDLAARLASKDKMNETDALHVPERMEVFGRIAQTYAVLNDEAWESYRAAVEGVNEATWEDKMAEEAPGRRAELEGIIRHLQGGEDRQEAASEVKEL